MKQYILLFALCLSTQSYTMHYLRSAVGYTHSYYNQQLFKAAAENDTILLAHALKNGANCNTKDQDGHTPLYIAVHNGNTEVVKLLLSCPTIDLSLTYSTRSSYTTTIFNKALQQDNLALLELFMQHTNFYPKITLHDAVLTGNTDKVALFLKHGVFVNSYSKDMATPLHRAASYGYTDICRLLLQAGADKNDTSNRHRYTPLMLSAMGNHAATAQLLLEAGTNLSLKNSSGDTALDIAQRTHPHLIDTVFKPYLKTFRQQLVTKIITRVQPDQQSPNNYISELPNTIIDAVASYAADTSLEKLLLNTHGLSCKAEYAENVQKALLAGAHVDARNKNGEAALHIAAHLGLNETVKLLLDYGADVNSQNTLRSTALMSAFKNGYVETLKLLLEHGAQVNIQDYDGTSILHYRYSALAQIRPEYKAMLEILVHAGLNLHLVDNQGRIAFDTFHPSLIAENFANEGKKFIKSCLKDKKAAALEKLLATAQPQNVSQPGPLCSVPKTLFHTIAQHASNTQLEKQLFKAITDPRGPESGSDSEETEPEQYNAKNLVTMQQALAAGACIDYNHISSRYTTALIKAIECNNTPAVKLLLDYGADPHIIFTNTPTSRLYIRFNDTNIDMLYSLSVENSAILELLLKAGLNPNIRDTESKTLLHYAVKYDKLEAIKILLKYGAIIDARDVFSHTPLYKADYSNTQVLQLLLEAGANPLDGLIYGNLTPAYQAQRYSKSSEQLFAFWIAKRRAYILSKILNQATDNKSSSFTQLPADMLKIITAYAADTSLEKRLEKAISKSDIQAAHRALAAGANPNYVLKKPSWGAGISLGTELSALPEHYCTFLHDAINTNNVELIELLIAYGAQVNAQDSKGCTPLHYAVYRNLNECIIELLSHGADPRIKNNDGRSAKSGPDSSLFKLLYYHFNSLSKQ